MLVDERRTSRVYIQTKSVLTLRSSHHRLGREVFGVDGLNRVVAAPVHGEDLEAPLSKDLKRQKVIVFTYYRDTARYLYRELGGDNGADFRKDAGLPSIRRMDGGASPAERSRLIQAFAPQSNNRPGLVDSDAEVDILISTDVLSEGQNLHDCGVLVNYDLHWNPTRMVPESWAHRPHRVEAPPVVGAQHVPGSGAGAAPRLGGESEPQDH